MPRLVPKGNRPCLSVAEVVRLSEAEFGFVNIDAKCGLKYVANRLLADIPCVDQATADQHLDPLAESVEMIVGDDRRSDDHFLKCYVIPGEPIQIENVSEGQAELTECLIQRLQRVLGYELKP